MRFVVSGGSNSILRRGWVGQFAARVPDIIDINISVGAATSSMGLARTLTAAQLQPGDAFIWEYALNDQNHIDQKGNDPDTLLRHCELALRHAITAGAQPFAIVLTSASHAFGGADQPGSNAAIAYRRDLLALFRHYGVPTYDVMTDVPKRLGRSLAQTDYSDPDHIDPEGPVTADVVNWLAASVRKATGPLPMLKGLRADERHLAICDSAFEGGTRGEFSNALIYLPVWSVAEPPSALRWQNSTGQRVEVQGFIMLAQRESGILRVTVGTDQILVSTSLKSADKTTLVRFLSLSAASGRRFRLDPGEELTLGWHLGPQADVVNDHGFARRVPSAMLRATQTRVSSVLVETWVDQD